MKEPSGNGYVPIIAQAIEEMKAEWGDTFSLEQINLAELERRTGISRGKLRRLKKNGFQDSRRNGDSGKHKITKLTGYSGIIDTLLKQGVSNSTVILNRLQESGFEGKLTIVKDYIAAHKYLLPAKRQQVAPQGNRGRRYSSDPGETYQMDWGFTDVLDHDGNIYRVACFAMICHHCGERYIEFFPNMIFTSNKNPALWREDFNEDTTLLCALDRIFDDAMVFKLRGESFRGKKLETISLQTGKVKAVESVTEMKG